MREIKFRAWDKKENRMLQHRLFETWWYTLSENDPTGHPRASIPVQSQVEMKGRLIPMQFTGLKDKNDKEIYEGDIVRLMVMGKCDCEDHLDGTTHIDEDFIGVIKFATDPRSTYMVGWILSDGQTTYDHLLSDVYELEIIGNKFDNPELLK